MKLPIFLYWIDLLVMMCIPLMLIAAAKTHNYTVLDNASSFAVVWLAVAGIFLFFAVVVGMKLKSKGLDVRKETTSRHNLKEGIFIIVISLVGVGLGLAQKIIALDDLWDTLIVYWFVFTFFLVRAMEKFIQQCRSEHILP